MLAARHSRQLGYRAFEVEWCIELPRDEHGDIDSDAAVYKRKFVTTIEEALAVSRLVIGSDQYGCVAVTPVEWHDPFGDSIPQTYRWEYCGDSRHFSGSEQPGTEAFDD